MPNAPKTPLRNFRVDDELWAKFGAAAAPDRSEVLRDLMRWYVRRGRLPRRPDVRECVEPPAASNGSTLHAQTPAG